MRCVVRNLLSGLIIILVTFPANAEFIPKLITNSDKKIDLGIYGNYIEELEEDAVSEKPLESNVYDLSFTAYDKEFAKEFGLVDKNITEMDKGLRFIEVRMITEGKRTNCYYNIILDKDIALDFPAENYIAPSAEPFPPQIVRNHAIKLPEGYDPRTHPKSSTFKLLHHKRGLLLYDKNNGKARNYYGRTYLGNRGYKFHKTGKPFSNGGVVGMSLQSYTQDRSPSYNIVSLLGACNITGMLKYPESAIWIRKKGKSQSSLNLQNYYTFKIPQKLLNDFMPTLSIYAQRKHDLKAERIKRIKQKMENNNEY